MFQNPATLLIFCAHILLAENNPPHTNGGATSRVISEGKEVKKKKGEKIKTKKK